MKTTFYFDTGVRPYSHNPPVKLMPGQVLRGTIQIPFDCEDVPKNASFMFACDNPNLPDANAQNVIVKPITNSVLVSKYAYFRVPSC